MVIPAPFQRSRAANIAAPVVSALTTDLAMLERWLAPAGKTLVDVGCGGGALVRELAARGARPIGVEISDAQLARARASDDGAQARYLVGRAEALPLPDASVDGVVFMRSLHHVPVDAMPAALMQARRVLAPAGIVYAAEPVPQGDYYRLTSLVEDELAVREAAQRALDDAAAAGLRRVARVDYAVGVRVAGLDALRTRFVSVDPARASTFDAKMAEIAAAFAALGEPGAAPDERHFIQPMRAHVLTV
jgi:SAM-dependent methyltransferase